MRNSRILLQHNQENLTQYERRYRHNSKPDKHPVTHGMLKRNLSMSMVGYHHRTQVTGQVRKIKTDTQIFMSK